MLLNLKYALVTSFPFACVWLALTGGIEATPYTNFMFLAIAKTNLFSDLQLQIEEREMVVNMLILSSSIGKFLAMCFRLAWFQTLMPEAIYIPPG